MASEEEARVQLGIWTAAWHKRISRLVELGDGAIITLPLLIAVGHHWKLYFACDRGPDGIEIYGYLDIGDTKSLPGFYKFLAAFG
ncbi:hypothetical protein MGN70_001403 [Eutypa lata]|nr:hypothetical protein MGN70_001403 [Eutypa lata]